MAAVLFRIAAPPSSEGESRNLSGRKIALSVTDSAAAAVNPWDKQRVNSWGGGGGGVGGRTRNKEVGRRGREGETEGNQFFLPSLFASGVTINYHCEGREREPHPMRGDLRRDGGERGHRPSSEL